MIAQKDGDRSREESAQQRAELRENEAVAYPYKCTILEQRIASIDNGTVFCPSRSLLNRVCEITSLVCEITSLTRKATAPTVRDHYSVSFYLSAQQITVDPQQSCSGALVKVRMLKGAKNVVPLYVVDRFPVVWI